MHSHIFFVFLFLVNCAGDSTIDQSGTSSSGSSSDSSSTTTGTITGQVIDGSTGSALASASVYVSGSESDTTTTSDGSGNFTISNAPTGTATLIGTKTSYGNGTETATVTEDGTTSNVKVVLLPSSYSSSKYVFVLTWAEHPADLDSHLWVPNGTPFHVKWNSKGDNDGTLDSDPFAALDVDDTSSFGPETTTVLIETGSAKYAGTYRYYIHKFDGTGAITVSQAKVRVFNSGTLIKTYTIPTSGAGDYWHVFDLSGTTFTDVNTIGGQPAQP